MKFIFSLFFSLIFLSEFSYQKQTNLIGVKYSVYSYMGPTTIDSFFISKMDVYSFSDYLVKIEFVTSRANNDVIRIISANGKIETSSSAATHSFIDTAKISIISKTNGKQYFIKSLGPILMVDSVKNYSGSGFSFQFSRNEDSDYTQRYSMDTTIKQTRYSFEKTVTKSDAGKDSLTGYFYFYSEQPFNNVFTFPKPDNYAGLKIVFNQYDYLIEHLASGFSPMSTQEIRMMNGIVEKIMR